jgi:hypothetical protein
MVLHPHGGFIKQRLSDKSLGTAKFGRCAQG